MDDRSLVRRNIVLELQAITTYEELASKAEDERVKKLFLDISKEEKVHVGELQSLLAKLDDEFTPSLKDGAEEEHALNKCDVDMVGIDSEEVSKPYPNEHSCRIVEPSSLHSFRRTKRGKVSMIWGKNAKGELVLQAIRYPISAYTEEEARSSCKSHGGEFHASSSTEKNNVDQPVPEEAENDGEKGENETQKPRQTGIGSYPADNGVFNLSSGDRIDLTFAPSLFTKDEDGNNKLYKTIHLLNQLASTSDLFKNHPCTLEIILDYYDTCMVELAKRQLMDAVTEPFYIAELEKRKKKPKLHLEPQDQQYPTGSAVAPNQDGATPAPVGSPSGEMSVGGG